MSEDGHKYRFSGVDTSRLKRKDNGWVWVVVGKKQIRMRQEEAEREGYEIIPTETLRVAQERGGNKWQPQR